jgi:uncharacterized protein (DUF1499 family)
MAVYHQTSDTYLKIEAASELIEIIDEHLLLDQDELLIKMKAQLHRDLINMLKS